MPNVTDADTASQAAVTTYRPVHRNGHPGEWVVVSGTPDKPGSTVLVGFKTEKHAQEAAHTLNALEDSPQEEQVLQRMLAGARPR